MFRKLMKTTTSIIFILLLSLSVEVKAATFTDNQTVDANKKWTIKFNKEVLLDDSTKQNIKVTNSKDEIANTTLSFGENKKTVIVNAPIGGYKEGESYKLIIGNKVHSKYKRDLKQSTTLNFNIKNKIDNSVKFLDLVKEDGKTTIDEDLKKPGIQISLNNKESLKIKVVEKDDKTTVVKEINDKLIDLGKDSVVNKAVVGDTVTLTAIKEGKSTITITQGSQKLNLEVTVKNSKVELISEIERHGVRGVIGNKQQSYIKVDVFANEGILQKDQDIIIAGRTVKVHKGNNPYEIKCKIMDAFKDDENWIAENLHIGIQGNRPVRVTLTSKSQAKNQDRLAIDTSEIRFTQLDWLYGRAPISEVKEICNVTVKGVSNKQETINVNVTGEKISALNQNVSVDVKSTDTTKDVAKSIYNAFQANELLNRVYTIKLDEANSKIILTQKMGDLLDTKVTIK